VRLDRRVRVHAVLERAGEAHNLVHDDNGLAQRDERSEDEDDGGVQRNEGRIDR
jgi:hypothetical protein